MVRITVDRDEAAAAVPKIRERLERLGFLSHWLEIFHYIGHKLLSEHPACAEALAKYRINPGNVGFGAKKIVNLQKLLRLLVVIINLFALA